MDEVVDAVETGTSKQDICEAPEYMVNPLYLSDDTWSEPAPLGAAAIHQARAAARGEESSVDELH